MSAATPRRRCPICWRRVSRTNPHHNVERHFDSAGNTVCPASGEPYRITLPEKPRREEVAA